MKQTRLYPTVTVSPKAEKSIIGGHPWVYDTEIIFCPETQNGQIVDVVTQKGRYLGSAFISQISKIRLRIFSRNASDTFNADFWRRRIAHAWEYRKAVLGGEVQSCRVIFGEADMFPGLTVDKFDKILVVQTLCIGIEKIKDILFPLIQDVITEDGYAIDGIFQRNDAAIRRLEGMEEYKGWYDYGKDFPENTKIEIKENSVVYEVDFENGQKTGFFLDQRFNRAAVGRIAKGKKVLDCFTHTGSFALNAAQSGASHVTAVDVSGTAIELAKQNAQRNEALDKMDFVCADVFELLPQLSQGGQMQYDIIILDPPAFTKSRKTAENAMRGYKEINYRAMKLLPRGGYLATCSCSHFAKTEDFIKMLISAAKDASVELKQVYIAHAGPDHPYLLNVPETDYLKFFIFQII